jgi:hypothetical protein
MIKSIFLTAFDLTKKNAIVLIGVFLSIVLLSFLMGLLGELLRQQIIASVVFNIFSLIVNITFTIATIKLAFAIISDQTLLFDAIKPTKIEALKIVRSSFYLILLIISMLFLTLGFLELLGVIDPSFTAFFDDLSKDPNHLFNYTATHLTYTFAILLLIILPTLIIYIRLGFVNYLIIDKGIEVGSAFMISYQFTKGKLGFIILLYLAIIALNIIGLAFLLVGVLFTIPMSFIIIALAYRYLFPKELLEEPSFLI